ncbi:MAG: ABC transporter substrate-binding protein, partial [Candidatus Binatia bacterium]
MYGTFLLILAIIANVMLSSAAARAADAVLDGAKKDGTVAVYSGSSAGDAAKLIAAFESKYPFVKVSLFRGNNERVVNKILTEGRTGACLFDVATIDGLNGWVLKEHDYLQPYKSKETQAFPAEFQDPSGLLPCCMTVVANMIAYNTRQVAKKDAPTSYQDLLDPKWKGNLGMDPDEAEWFRALISIWGKEKTVKYFGELARQGPSMRRGHTLLSNFLAAGEFPVAVNTFGHRILELKSEGAPVELVHTDPLVVA